MLLRVAAAGVPRPYRGGARPTRGGPHRHARPPPRAGLRARSLSAKQERSELARSRVGPAPDSAQPSTSRLQTRGFATGASRRRGSAGAVGCGRDRRRRASAARAAPSRDGPADGLEPSRVVAESAAARKSAASPCTGITHSGPTWARSSRAAGPVRHGRGGRSSDRARSAAPELRSRMRALYASTTTSAAACQVTTSSGVAVERRRWTRSSPSRAASISSRSVCEPGRPTTASWASSSGVRTNASHDVGNVLVFADVSEREQRSPSWREPEEAPARGLVAMAADVGLAVVTVRNDHERSALEQRMSRDQ